MNHHAHETPTKSQILRWHALAEMAGNSTAGSWNVQSMAVQPKNAAKYYQINSDARNGRILRHSWKPSEGVIQPCQITCAKRALEKPQKAKKQPYCAVAGLCVQNVLCMADQRASRGTPNRLHYNMGRQPACSGRGCTALSLLSEALPETEASNVIEKSFQYCRE